MQTGYNDRRVWTYGFALLALYPFLVRTQTNLREKTAWVALTVPCALWATLNVEKQESAGSLYVWYPWDALSKAKLSSRRAYANWLYAATAALCSYLAWRKTSLSASVPPWLPTTFTTILPMGSLISRAIHSLQSKEGLSGARQLEAWMQLCMSPLTET